MEFFFFEMSIINKYHRFAYFHYQSKQIAKIKTQSLPITHTHVAAQISDLVHALQ